MHHVFGIVALVDGHRGRMIIEVYNGVRNAKQPMFLRSRYFTTKNVDLIPTGFTCRCPRTRA